jgi:hypothetical protein
VTEGAYRVGIDFNPGKNPIVAELKRQSASLIDLILAIPQANGREDEITRLQNIAAQAIEDGAMWAVKAATKPAR